MHIQELKTWEQIPNQYKWNLNDIFANQKESVASEKMTRSLAEELTAWQGIVHGNHMKSVSIMFNKKRSLRNYLSYAWMQQDQDGANPDYKTFTAKADTLMVMAKTASAFLEPELLQLPVNTLLALRDDPDNAQYSVYFDNLLRQKPQPHVLSMEEETILAKS